MLKTARVYSDIDFNFIAHPVTGNLTKVYDVFAIKQSIANIILTNFYERPFQPTLATGLSLFETADVFAEENIKTSIIDSLREHEPRARNVVVTTNVLADVNNINVSVTFEVVNVESPVTLNLVLHRSR